MYKQCCGAAPFLLANDVAFFKAAPAPANKKIGSSSTIKLAAPAPQHCVQVSGIHIDWISG